MHCGFDYGILMAGARSVEAGDGRRENCRAPALDKARRRRL